MFNKNKTNKTKSLLFGALSILILIVTYFLVDRYSFCKELAYYPLPADNDTTLTIGIIGDSWVENGTLDTLLYQNLLKNGISANILFSGHSGAKTKIIYQNLFKEDSAEHSSRFVIEKRPDFCIVIAGVNDAAVQIGSEYYSHHLNLITRTLLHYKIKPVIVSLPEFGIEEHTREMNILSENGYRLASYINNGGEIDNIRKYRKVFDNKLNTSRLKDSVLIIDFDAVCTDHNKFPELYSNSGHLSRKGFERLSEVISRELVSILNSRQNI